MQVASRERAIELAKANPFNWAVRTVFGWGVIFSYTRPTTAGYSPALGQNLKVLEIA